MTLMFLTQGIRRSALLGAVAAALPLSAAASPILYEFTWTGSGSYTFANAPFELSIPGRVDDVVSAGVNYVNNGPVDTGLVGTLSGLGANGIDLFTPLFVAIDHGASGPGLLYGDGGTFEQFMEVNHPAFPGIDAYDLSSTFGPVPNLLAQNQPTLDLGGAGAISFDVVSDETFRAVHSASGEIVYLFSWTGSGTFGFSNQDFRVTISGDTVDVTSAGVNYVNNGPMDTGLVGTLSGPVASGTNVSTPLFVSIDHDSTGPALLFGNGETLEQYLEVNNPSFSGIDAYDLTSSFGPVPNELAQNDQIAIDLGAAGQFRLLDVRNASFRATSASAPEPGAGLVSLTGLGLLGYFQRRMRRKILG